MKRKIYVASSWRNEHQQTLVNELRQIGHEVYDFKNPDGEAGFKWSNMDENWQGWTMDQYRENLKSDYAQFGFNRDFDAMKAADICVLCLPCGRSAHLEAGWMKGAGKKVIAYIHPDDRIEPELMYGILDGIALSIQDVEQMLNVSTLPFKLLKINAAVRYYEDGTIDGVDDISFEEQKQGVKPRVPCVEATEADCKEDGWLWCLDIDAETGIITNWKQGTVADIHYKVCDGCEIDYFIGGVKQCDNDDLYCPSFLCPEEPGYGDYIIMHIEENGQIRNWKESRVEKWAEEQQKGGNR